MLFDHGETVQHLPHHPAGKDSRGYPIPAGHGPAVDVEGVGVDYPSSMEPREGTTQKTTVDLVVFLPPGFVCDPRDRFVVRGKTYEVEGLGEALPQFFTGSVFCTEVQLRRHDA